MAGMWKKGDAWHCTFRFRGKRYDFAAGNLTEEQASARDIEVDETLDLIDSAGVMETDRLQHPSRDPHLLGPSTVGPAFPGPDGLGERRRIRSPRRRHVGATMSWRRGGTGGELAWPLRLDRTAQTASRATTKTDHRDRIGGPASRRASGWPRGSASGSPGGSTAEWLRSIRPEAREARACGTASAGRQKELSGGSARECWWPAARRFKRIVMNPRDSSSPGNLRCLYYALMSWAWSQEREQRT